MKEEVDHGRGLLRRATDPAEAGNPAAVVASICVGLWIPKATLSCFLMRASKAGNWTIPGWVEILLYPGILTLGYLTNRLSSYYLFVGNTGLDTGRHQVKVHKLGADMDVVFRKPLPCVSPHGQVPMGKFTLKKRGGGAGREKNQVPKANR